MISVVIPLYNKEKQIVNTLQTVLNQTFQDFEIVIVDDGSTDNSVAESQKVKDSRIKIVHQSNAGVSAARNRGIEEAKYDLIAFLDADDEWKPNFLFVLYNLFLKYPECSVYACDYELKYSNGATKYNIIRNLHIEGNDGIMSNYFEVAYCSSPPLWTSAIIVKKDAIKSLGGFPVGIKSGEDLLTWAKIALNFKIAYTKERLSVYNMGDGYILTNKPSRKQDYGDPVGLELIKIYKSIKFKEDIYLKKYISMWFKMRAVTALRFGLTKETIIESIKSIRYNPINFKVYTFILLSIIPFKIRKRIIAFFAKKQS